MNGLKAARERSGLSQRALAAKAKVAFRTVQLIESGSHDARQSTLAKLSTALAIPPPGPAFPVSKDTLSEAAASILRDGFDSWKRHLFNFVDAFRRSPSLALVEQPPSTRLDARLLALLAATVERLAAERGVEVPLWCAGVRPLRDPWFVAGVENLMVMALIESPAEFRRRGVFVMNGFLDRA